jgi:predicted nucleic acid-binding Zn ribbon protein
MPLSGPVHTSRSSELALLAREPGAYGFYRWRNIAINAWASQPTGAAVQVLARLTEKSLTECPEGIASIHWIESGAGLPTAEARLSLGEIAKRYGQHLICVSVVLHGSGFWASALRSALTGVVLLAPRTYSLRFHADIPELTDFVLSELQQRCGRAPESERVRRAVEEALADFRRP